MTNTHIKIEISKEHTFECNLLSGIYPSLAEVALHPLRKQIKLHVRLFYTVTSWGAFHYAKDSGNFGWNSNGKVCFSFFRPEYSGSPLEVVHLFRLEDSDQYSPLHF